MAAIEVDEGGVPDFGKLLQANEQARAYVPLFSVANLASFNVTEDGKTVALQFAGVRGNVSIEMPAEQIESVMITLDIARKAAVAISSGEGIAVPVRPINTWESGLLPDGNVLMVIDKELPSAQVFGMHPKTALDFGRAIVQCGLQGIEIARRIARMQRS